jgi:hypothetical protein
MRSHYGPTLTGQTGRVGEVCGEAGVRRERVRGIEPPSPAWKAGALPLSYTRTALSKWSRKLPCRGERI